MPIYDRRQIFVREVLEKCLRLSYHEKLTRTLPEEFESLIPVNPSVVFVLEDESHPAYNQSQAFRKSIENRAPSREILFDLQLDRLAAQDEKGLLYDPDMVAVFTAVLIDISSKTFSHTFSAFTRFVYF
jgi:nuclear cap-binding protein subunit 1